MKVVRQNMAELGFPKLKDDRFSGSYMGQQIEIPQATILEAMKRSMIIGYHIRKEEDKYDVWLFCI